MIKQKKLLGVVSWPPNRQACYVRAQLPSREGDHSLPLSIKATFDGFDRCVLVKGALVEVARSDPRDHRRYEILRVLPESSAILPDESVDELRQCCEGDVKLEEELRRGECQIRFFLGGTYLKHNSVYPVLMAAFGLGEQLARALWKKDSDGFRIVCREDQFARFMIYRDEAVGLRNGFADLKAELIPVCGDAYSRIANATGVDRQDIKKVLLALSYSAGGAEARLTEAAPLAEVDVSGN